MPTIKELNSVTDKTKVNPAIELSYFPNTYSLDYWSTLLSPCFSGVWKINFDSGSSFAALKSDSIYVRLVRGGQYFDSFDYTKLDSNGNDLPDDVTNWSCIRDNHSGLIWEVKTEENQYLTYTFDQAPFHSTVVNSQGLCGYSDWRIPDIDELISIVDYNNCIPAIKATYFPNTYSPYYWWSATSYAGNSSDAWAIYFDYGYVSNTGKDYNFFVRLVRSGQSSVPLPVNQLNAVIDFLTLGLWKYDNGLWTQLHSAPTSQLKSADIDNDGQQDVIVDFGSQYGVWLYMNNTTWTQLHSVTSEGLTVGDMDNNGQDDIIIDFGSQYGLWVWMNNSTWTKLHSVSAEGFVTADMDNNGQDEVVIDFGNTYGVWIYQNNSTWHQLHDVSSSYLTSGDMDDNGQDDVVVDFGSQYGIWVYYNNSTWTQLHSVSSHIQPVTGDLDGNGLDDVVIDFGSQYGIWVWMNNSSWVQIHGTNSEQMSVRYLDDNNQADLLVDFGSQYGLWVWKNNSTWEQLHSESPRLIGY